MSVFGMHEKRSHKEKRKLKCKECKAKKRIATKERKEKTWRQLALSTSQSPIITYTSTKYQLAKAV